MKIPHNKLNRLKAGDLITIEGESEYEGYHMIFEKIVGPFMYVRVNVYDYGNDFKTIYHFKFADFVIYSMDNKFDVETEDSNELEITIYNPTTTLLGIFKLLENAAVIEYQPDDSFESILTVGQLYKNCGDIGLIILNMNSHLLYIINPNNNKFKKAP